KVLSDGGIAMLRETLVAAWIVAGAVTPVGAGDAQSGTREFKASAGGKLTLALGSGGSVKIAGTGGSSAVLSYTISCSPDCEINFEPSGSDVKVVTRFQHAARSQTGDVDLDIRVPSHFDVSLDSMGGGLEIDGVTGTFTGETKGGAITLHDVEGNA